MNAKTARRTLEIQPLGPYSLEESANFVGAITRRQKADRRAATSTSPS
jgi:hypothetical protein